MLELVGLDAHGPDDAPGELELANVIGEWHLGTRFGPYGKRQMELRIGRELPNDRIPAWLTWMEGRVKYMAFTHDWIEAYDLDQDPEEQVPLRLSPEVRASRLKQAQVFWAEKLPEALEASEAELDDDTLERMRALGYADDL